MLLLLLILLLILLLVHQFAGLCSQQKQMDNICPGRPAAPTPRSPHNLCLQVPRHAPVIALLLYSDKPFFRDCRLQQGPGPLEQLRTAQSRESKAASVAGSRRPPGQAQGATGVVFEEASGDRHVTPERGIPVFLLSPVQTLPPAVLLSLKSKEILLLVIKLHARFKIRDLYLPSCDVGLVLKDQRAITSSLSGPNPWVQTRQGSFYSWASCAGSRLPSL